MRLTEARVRTDGKGIHMENGKTTNVVIELNDGVGIIDGLGAILSAMKELDTKVEVLENHVLEWDISKNAPGYSVKMRDEGVGKPHKFVVGKAKRKTPTRASRSA